MTALTDHGLRRHLVLAAAMFSGLPPAIGGVLLSLAGYYAFTDLLRATLSYAGLFILATGLVAVAVAGRLANGVIAIARMPKGQAAGVLRGKLKPALLYLLAGLLIYCLAGMLVLDASLVALGLHATFGSAWRATRLSGALLPTLAAALPLFFFINATLDLYFAPRRIVAVATSLHVKLLVSCLLVPLLVDVMLLAYFTNRDGYLDHAALNIWVGLVAITVTAFLMAQKDLGRVLRPLLGFINSPRELLHSSDVLVPSSLDELGVVTARLQERLAKEETLRHDVDVLTERLVLATEAVGLGIYDHDIQRNRMYWSPQMRSIFGVGAEEAVGFDTLMRFVHPDDRDRFILAVARSREFGGDGTYEVEYRIVRGDGQTRWLANSGRMLLAEVDGQRQPVRSVGVVHDISSSKAAENQRKDLESALRESRRLESVGSIASGIAHDFNNLLAVVSANLAELRRFLHASSDARAHLDLAGVATRRGMDLVREISELARGLHQPIEVVAVRPVVQECIALVRTGASPDVTFSLDVGDDELHVSCRGSQLQQIVGNLIRNAMQAIGTRSGMVAVSVGRVRSDGDGPGSKVRIAVSDSGAGMSADTLARIFEPFFTARSGGGGTGLGLTVVDRVVRSLGGVVRVQSTEGQGTTFEVLLPEAGRTSGAVAQP